MVELAHTKKLHKMTSGLRVQISRLRRTEAGQVSIVVPGIMADRRRGDDVEPVVDLATVVGGGVFVVIDFFVEAAPTE